MSRYLLIDDDDIIQFIHKKVISAADGQADISAVFSVANGLQLLTDWGVDHLPDFIFIDISMPVNSGFDYLDALISDYPALHAALLERSRVFLLTSSVNPRDQQRAQGYALIERMLSKPLTPEMMMQLGTLSSETASPT